MAARLLSAVLQQPRMPAAPFHCSLGFNEEPQVEKCNPDNGVVFKLALGHPLSTCSTARGAPGNVASHTMRNACHVDPS